MTPCNSTGWILWSFGNDRFVCHTLQNQPTAEKWLIGGGRGLRWCWQVVSHIGDARRNGKTQWQRDC